MKGSFAPPPPPGELESMPVHVVLRDYPEALAVLRRFGVSPEERGGDPLGEALGVEGFRAVEEAVSWRRHRGRASAREGIGRPGRREDG